MSDVNANINISINSKQALGQLRSLQNQISDFNKSVIAGNVAAAQSQKALAAQLAAQVGASKAFSTSITNVESSVSRLDKAIAKNKLSLGQYFRYGVAASGTFGRGMKEHAEIMELAGDRVKRLQTQYVALGEAQNGMTRAMAMRPLQLHNADSAIGIQRQQIFNKLMHDGSTAMVNWGKNTQWAGRQLMVGFTVPLTIFGGIAGKIFMDLEKQIIQFKRVYGDLDTPTAERDAMIGQVKELGKEFTKYGIAVNDTIALSAKAAATGAQGADLIAITTEATRLATLGQIDYQQALDSTIAMQTAFRISSDELAGTTNFLNAVENQTVTSLDDITQAIPLVAPVIKGLGGDVQDLAVFMTAMREGGISANEGANALKSGLASLINPTKAAREQLGKVKIDIDAILSRNKGDLRGLVMEFGSALNTLGKFERQQTLAKMFGKYQFARLGALFSNVAKEGSQAQRVIDLTGESAKNLASIAEGELGQIEQAVGVKFTAAVEKLKLAIAPIGEAFLKIATPLIQFATTIADKFNELPEGMKGFITWGVAIAGVVVPTVIMLVGLLGNFLGNVVKIANAFRMFAARMRGGGSALQYLESEELDAMAAAASLEGQTTSLTAALNVQRGAVYQLARAYESYVAGARAASSALPQGFRPPAGRRPRGYATGGFVAGRGNKDTEPALLTPGEFVVNKKAAQKNADLLAAMNAGKLGMYNGGTKGEFAHIGRPLQAGLESLSGSMSGAVAGTRAGQDIRAMAQVFGNTVKALLYPSLGFMTSGSINNRLDKSGVGKEEMLADWDSRGIKKWQTSVTRAGLKMTDVEEDLILLDKAMREQIASVKEGTMINDKLVEQMYDAASSQLPAKSKLKSGFGGLRNRYSELRTNVSASVMNSFGVPVKRVKDKFSGFIGDKWIRSSNRWGVHRAGGWEGDALRGIGATELASTSERAGRQAASAVGKGAGTNSPSKITQQQGQDVAEGLEIGIKEGTPEAVAAAEKMGAEVAAASDPNAPASGRKGRRGARREAGAPNYRNGVRLEGGNQNSRVAPKTAGHAAMLSAADGVTQQFIGVKDEAEETRGKFKGLGAKLGAGMFAMDGLLFGMSMMDNGVGEFAQKIMPAAFAVQGLSMMLPMLTNPFGIALAGLAAVGGGLFALDAHMKSVKENAIRLADAMSTSADAIDSTAEFYGRATFAKRQKQIDLKRQGVTSPEAKKATDYLASDIGKALKEQTTLAFEEAGSSAAMEGLAAKMSTMVMSGALSANQAESIVTILADQMGNEQFGINVKAKIKDLIGPNGKSVKDEPFEVAVTLVANQKETQQMFTATMTDAISKATDVGQMSGFFTQQVSSDGLFSTDSLGAMTANVIGFGTTTTTAFEDIAYVSDIARNVLGFFNQDMEDAIAASTAFGKVVGNNIAAGYTILDSAIARNKKLIAEADPEDRAKLRKKALKEEAELRNQITDALNEQAKSFASMPEGLQVEALRGVGDSISALYENDPVMKAVTDTLLGRTSHLEKNVRFNIETSLASGQLNPMVVSKIFDLVGNDESAGFRIKGVIEVAGLDKSDELMTQLAMIQDSDMGSKLTGQLTSTMAQWAAKLKPELIDQAITGLKEFNSLPEDMTKNISVDTFGYDEIVDLGRVMKNFDALPKKASKTRIARFFDENFKRLEFGVNWFSKLPDTVQKTFLAEYTVAFTETGTLSAAGQAALQKAFPDMNMGTFMSQVPVAGQREMLTDTLQEQANEDAAEINTKGTSSTSSSSSGGGGGGGSKEKSWLEQQIENYKAMEKLYTTAGENASKLVEKQGFFFGVIEKLRSGRRGKNGNKKMPTIPQFIIDSLGDGPEGLKNAMALMNLSEKALKQFVSLSKKAMVGQFVEKKKQEIQANKQKGWVRKILESSGIVFSKEEIDEILSDQSAIDAILASAGKKRESVLNTIRQSMTPESESEGDKWQKLADDMSDAFDSLEDAKRDEFAKKVYTSENLTVKELEKQIDLKNNLIDIQQALVDSKEEEINDYQHLNDLDQQAIDNLNRDIEMQDRKAEALKREDEIRNRAASGLERELELMSRQEQTIRDAYQKRIQALDEVARLNERILQAQQDQLAISKALSTGDVYAAAEAAAAMQANQVKFASEQTKAGLEQGMENEVAGLTSNGMSKAQIEAQIQAIKDQSYQTSLQIRDIEDYIYNVRQTKILPLEDQIFNRNLLIRDLNNEIYNINESQIEPLKNQVSSYEDIISKHEKMLEQEVTSLTIAGMTRDEWEKKSAAMIKSLENAKALTPELEAIRAKYDEIRAAAEAAAGAAARIGGSVPAAPNGGGSGGKTPYFDPGTMSVTYRASGGGIPKGTDSVPAMLSPGEFVIRKAAVDKYGAAMFESINQGSFSMPKYAAPASFSAAAPQGGQRTATNVNAPVYNNTYSVNVSASTNASADDIARTVIAKIKTIESSNIRRINGY